MKITIVQGAFLPVPPMMGGAVEKVWFALGQEFARRGHEVTHIGRSWGDLPRQEIVNGVRYKRVSGFDLPSSIIRLKLCDLIYSWRAFRQLPKADILVTNTFWLPMLARTSASGKLYVHIQRYPKGQMRFYSHAARLQTVSRAIAEAITWQVPHLASRIAVIPNPLPRNILPQSEKVFASREKVILYVGRIHPEKGLHLLLEAAVALGERTADWRIVIVGPSEIRFGGGGEEYLKRLKQISVPIEKRVNWVGPVFDQAALSSYYQSASLFVYPTLAEKGEALPLAPLEAMANGCAVLVSGLSCFRDYIEPGLSGFTFDHSCEHPQAALADAIAGVIRNAAAREKVAKSGKERTRDFGLDVVADQYLDSFAQLLDGAQGTAAPHAPRQAFVPLDPAKS